MKKWVLYLVATLALVDLLLLVGWGLKSCQTPKVDNETTEVSEVNELGYTQIPQELAIEMMKADDGLVVVDVRTQEEFDGGHIPGAICIQNESIVDAQPAELPDLDQTILVYCRSGRRSKEAAQKLADMGYTEVYEFGGIIDWTGEVVIE